MHTQKFRRHCSNLLLCEKEISWKFLRTFGNYQEVTEISFLENLPTAGKISKVENIECDKGRYMWGLDEYGLCLSTALITYPAALTLTPSQLFLANLKNFLHEFYYEVFSLRPTT